MARENIASRRPSILDVAGYGNYLFSESSSSSRPQRNPFSASREQSFLIETLVKVVSRAFSLSLSLSKFSTLNASWSRDVKKGSSRRHPEAERTPELLLAGTRRWLVWVAARWLTLAVRSLLSRLWNRDGARTRDEGTRNCRFHPRADRFWKRDASLVRVCLLATGVATRRANIRRILGRKNVQETRPISKRRWSFRNWVPPPRDLSPENGMLAREEDGRGRVCRHDELTFKRHGISRGCAA